jgi:hypothetical protein
MKCNNIVSLTLYFRLQKNNHCVCTENWYGIQCEFPKPCDQLRTDELFSPFQDNRDWADEFYLRPQIESTVLEVYNRPIYRSLEETDLIFYNGRRWVIAKSEDLKLQGNHSEALFSDSFHAYWSDYEVAFLSEPVDVDTPENWNTPVGLSWFKAFDQEPNQRIQKVNEIASLTSQLVCEKCSNTTNPCKYDGICTEEGICKCVTGSKGSLCQVAPLGNGRCNPYFNTAEFAYDGGDCCLQTCLKGGEFECGFGVVSGSSGAGSSGAVAIGYTGFPCRDPLYVNQIAGSLTLYEINERGYVVCGLWKSSQDGIDQMYQNFVSVYTDIR